MQNHKSASETELVSLSLSLCVTSDEVDSVAQLLDRGRCAAAGEVVIKSSLSVAMESWLVAVPSLRGHRPRLVWVQEVSVSSTGEDGREVAKMVLDHEGNPEWKCHSCDFRDSERETVVQHVRLAHGRGGPVSLLHAVHRCDVCGYAAGTKRAVQLHIDSSHGGQGGITSRCEGQTPDSKDNSGDSENMEYNESTRMFQCRQCPFSSKKRSEMRSHVVYHSSRPDCIFKCMFCPFYVPTKGELFEHLNVHGMEVPASVLEAASKVSSTPAPVPQEEPGSGSRNLACDSCPFETRSRAKLMHHRQFHKPKGLPFRCPHCTYNVTRRHLLSQHIRVHGMDPVLDDSIEVSSVNDNNQADDRSNSPSPSLTITPVNNVAASGNTGDDNTVTDSSLLPKLTDQNEDQLRQLTTRASTSRPETPQTPEIPGISAAPARKADEKVIYYCQQCPARFFFEKEIQIHTRFHTTSLPHKCDHCNYGARQQAHSSHISRCTHLTPNCYHSSPVPGLTIPHETSVETSGDSHESANNSRPFTASPPPTSVPQPPPTSKYMCDECPASFSKLLTLQYHQSLHGANNPHKCQRCSYAGKTEENLQQHHLLHSQERKASPPEEPSKKSTERDYSYHPPIKLKLIGLRPIASESGGRPQFKYYVEEQIPLSGTRSQGNHGKRGTSVNKCPSAFEKTEQYHVHSNLHGSNHKYRCRICDYSVKFYANFMMHINRHKYHERMLSQNGEGPPPEDIDPKYEPIISSNENNIQGEKPSKSRGEESNKENLDDVDLTTSERQHLLLQNKKGVKEPTNKEDEKERRVYYCQYCPYANVRRDAVDSHSLRHQANGGYGVYKCTFCDYTASQPNFIREHTKVHFRPFKYVHPEGFMRHDRQEILSAPIVPPGSKAIDGPKLQDSKNASNVEDSGIQVNFRSGDIVEAPNDFVISLRPGAKIRSGPGMMESSDPFATDGLDSAASSVQGENEPLPENEGASEDKTESMDVDPHEDPTEGKSQAQQEPLEDDQETRLTNGHVHMEVGEGSKEATDNEEESAKMEVVAKGEDLAPAQEGSSADQLPMAKRAAAQPEPLVSS
ncbi:hypothetical protein C7M84_020567 [Penaeus vannamei]|uniref:C2H2-type domain-containing protein n=1 Tax=Penaeus vannamei TaxID=6689 RepID=A0A3R7QAD6_PENVA|nr:hypothetical protein C7M84_020567 [Penaeus vannamei]